MNTSNDTNRIGKGMLWVFWLLTLGGLALYFGKLESNRLNPNQNITGQNEGDERIVKLERNAFGHYVATGYVNNIEVVFLLDTGATNVAVPEQLAYQLGLKRGGRHQVLTANGIATAYRTEIQSLHLGNIELNQVRASITPGMTGTEILLGMSALKHVDFSQSGKILTLIQADR